MPTYTYRCPHHGDSDIVLSFAEHDRGVRWCGACIREGRSTPCDQVFFPPHIARSTLRHEAHYDHALGAVVTGQRDREEVAKRLEQQDGRKIAFMDPQDTKGLGVSDEGLNATRRQKRDTGQTEGTKHFV